jgi:hypothetical protein
MYKQPGSPKLRSAYSRLPFYRRISQKDVELADRHQV